MDVERIIDDIKQLQEMFEAPDIRPLSASDISAANRRHDEMLAHSPWFRLWQRGLSIPRAHIAAWVLRQRSRTRQSGSFSSCDDHVDRHAQDATASEPR